MRLNLKVMTQKLPVFVMAGATLAVACLAVPSTVDAGTRYGIHRHFGAYGYAYAPRSAPWYGYAAPYAPYRNHDFQTGTWGQ